jgi:hypothetical protein
MTANRTTALPLGMGGGGREAGEAKGERKEHNHMGVE